jgi:hypothetical protein
MVSSSFEPFEARIHFARIESLIRLLRNTSRILVFAGGCSVAAGDQPTFFGRMSVLRQFQGR